MDGVLVDVTESYRETIARTVERFTGRAITRETIQEYKNEGGWSDDWRLSHHIVRRAGVPAPFDHLIYATDPSTLFVGASQAQILFNGLAPGFVGLCQMNFVVPGPPSQQTGGGVSSSSVSLTVGGNAANSVVLSVQ